MRNKGAVSVMLSVIVISLIIAAGAAGDVCSLAAAKAYAQRMNYMACKSVLAEYNSDLFRDYGFMAFDGGKDEIKDRVTEYTSMMSRVTEDPGDEIVLFDVILQDIFVDCSGMSLSEKNVFMEQVRELMKMKAIENGAEMLMDGILGKVDINGEVSEAKENYKRSEESKEDEIQISDGENNGSILAASSYDPRESGYDRVLRSRRVIDSLPSNSLFEDMENSTEIIHMDKEEELMELGEKSSAFLDKLYDTISAGTDKYFLVDYADEYFKNTVKDVTGYKETFFANEMEYVLKGYMSDSRNLTAVKKDLFLLRTALNIAHIYSDPEKCRLLLETAAGTGPYGAALQFVFAVAWAGAEAKEDIDRLLGGGKVPFLKENKDWKTDLESIFSGSVMISSEYEGGRGLDYTQYLKIFMLACSKEKLMERIMDLIQINMKGRYDIRFDLRNHIIGFAVFADYERQAYLAEILPGIIEDNIMHIEEEFSY